MYAGMHGYVPVYVWVCACGVRVYAGVHGYTWVYTGLQTVTRTGFGGFS